jgi:hypothetical protein
MREREKRQERIRAVEREYRASKTAVGLLAREMQQNPALGRPDGWGTRDARQVQENLEPTFIIRLYAEFEAGLREAWEHHFKQATHPPMRDLLLAIATRRAAADCLDDARAVQEYRNNLVHEGDPRAAKPMSFEKAQRYLAVFLSRLPPHWRV